MADDKSEELPLAPVAAEAHQTPTRPKHLKPSRRKKLIGAKRHTPRAATSSVKNSYTAPKTIARQRRKAEALNYREQGFTFEQIARQMRVSVSCAHGYVVEALKEIPAETAAEALRLELLRPDGIFSAHYDAAVNGDIPSGELAIRLIEKRCRLLGLFPREGAQQSLAVQVNTGGPAETPTMELIFVMPSHEELPDEPLPQREVKDVSPKITPAPRMDFDQPRTELDLEPNRPNSGVPLVGKRGRGWDWS